jgi:orotate phosphoribosyltransferase
MRSLPSSLPLEQYQREFVDFLLASGALTFGDFTTKSGRRTPYFINTGRFDDGLKIAQLGRFYAAHIAALGLGKIDLVFGPAYKGIPLAVTTAIALNDSHRMNVGFSFDRKEVKDHGDGGLIVGHPLRDNDRIVIVEDVITAGTTVRHIVPLLRKIAAVDIIGFVLAVDRCEKGTGELSAVQEAERDSAIRVYPIITIDHIVSYLRDHPDPERRLTDTQLSTIADYLHQYGAPR